MSSVTSLRGRPGRTAPSANSRAQHATPIGDATELAEDIWESDDELDAFLTDLRASRDASLA
ncbi:MAG TPA: hypothetical protein VFZ64_08880 [Nocardioidaceae bacterium]